MIQLPEKAAYIIRTIQSAGYEAYAVGGCVRDSLLERIPDDWDITTSAKPQVIKELFRRTVDTGIQHGTVTVMLGEEGFEVTTYRIDGEYEDGRHPREVTFTAQLAEDLRRRDFTINAMAYNDASGLVDMFGGMEDIRQGVIRCVGNPEERFAEDALRIMRAVRFSAQLGYRIQEETCLAIQKLAPNLSNISAERIQVELVKLVTSPHPEFLRTAYRLGITGVILPEFDRCMETEQRNPHHCHTVGEHILRSMTAIRPDKVLRLAMLFHDIGKPDTLTVDEEGVYHFHGHPAASEKKCLEILRRLKFDNHTVQLTAALVRYHDYRVEPEYKSVRRALSRMGEETFSLLFAVKRADIEAQSDYQKEEKEKELQAVFEIYQAVREQRQCVSLKELAVSGKDLIENAGINPGPELGDMLQYLLDLVIDDPAQNQKEKLIRAANARRVDKRDFQ